MTRELLQKELDNKEIKVKVLSVRKTEFNDYEVIFTRDLSYSDFNSKIALNNITEPEEDALVEDLEDAVFQIKCTLDHLAWYKNS